MSESKVTPSGDTVTLGGTVYEIGPLPVGTLKRVARGMNNILEAGPGVEAFERMVDFVTAVLKDFDPDLDVAKVRGDAKQFRAAYDTILRISGFEPAKESEPGEAAA